MFQYLYVSRLASGHDFSSFKPIVNASRLNNQACGISGALLFDGERFCQLLEGPKGAVHALAAKLALDPRHAEIVVLQDAESGPSRLRSAWTSGYCDADALDVLEAADGPRGPGAVKAFAALLAQADLAD